MTSGSAKPEAKPLPPWRRRRLAGLCLAALSTWVAAAEPGPVPTLESLLACLAARAAIRVHFVETRTLALLTQPLRLEGTLEFRPPDHLAKHVEQPAEEHYLIDDGVVTVRKPGQGADLTLNLQDYPPLQAFAESLRAPLAGDIEALRRYWQPSLGGSWRRWQLTLTPARAELGAVVRSVRLEGEQDRLLRMTLEEANGDHSQLGFQPLR